MGRSGMRAGLVASCLVVLAAALTAPAAPTVAQMLGFRPKQEPIDYSTPSVPDQERCKVELVKAGRASGWLLKDEKGEVLRRYMDTNGDDKIDVWSYYHKGLEVYREIDTNHNGRIDQYRWLHSGGSKWGIDANEDARIDAWKVISPEEVSQEVLQAVMKGDPGRLQALMLTEAEIKMLELPAAEANRVRDLLRNAPAKFKETAGKLAGQLDKARWDHLELPAPHCLPADPAGPKLDLIRYRGAIVFYHPGDDGQSGPIEAKGLQLGELIQVGPSWRIIDAPLPGSLANVNPPPGGVVVNHELEKLYEELGKIDKAPPTSDAPPAAHMEHHLKRADVLEKIVVHLAKMGPKEVKPEDREQWVKQLADALAAAVQFSATDKAPMQRLVALKEKVSREHGKDGNLTAYLVYTEIMADYNNRSSSREVDGAKLQKELVEQLAGFVRDHPRAENTPDALMQLGMISELMNEEVQAKKWYESFYKTYPNHPQVAKVKGAWDRLESNGKELLLAGPTLSGSTFDIKSVRNKVVVVYYWAQWNSQCVADLDKLRGLLTTYGSKGLEVVCVNLDNEAVAAKQFLQGKPAPTIHLFEPGGLSGRLGEQYGIVVLPTMFLVGKDGKVISHSEQMNTLEDSIKKALN